MSEDVEEAAARPRRRRRTGGDASAPAASTERRTSRPPAAARQLADLLGVDLAAVQPDPIDGYVTRESVARYGARRSCSPIRPPAPARAAATQTPTAVQRLSGMRGTIAKRMHASLHEMAQLTLTMDADMDAVVADRARRKAEGRRRASPTTSSPQRLGRSRATRALNAQVTAEGIARLPDVHVGLAVALDEGLLVPVVRHADRSPLADDRGRDDAPGRRPPAPASWALDDLEGGTFSVTALGHVRRRRVHAGDQPAERRDPGRRPAPRRPRRSWTVPCCRVTRLTLSLTWDHRVLDGAPAAAFCQTIVQLLADPAQLD